MEPYTWDKEQKRIIDPSGTSLSIQQILTQLNEMYKALNNCHLAWRMGNDFMLILDNVFLGAGTEPAVPDDAELEGEAEEGEAGNG